MSGKKKLTVKFSRAFSVYDEQSRRKEDSDWIQETFLRRECVRFVTSREREAWCKCGRNRDDHISGTKDATEDEEWTPETHTLTATTNAYGEVEFPGAFHTTRAKYLRLSHDTDVEDILQVLTDVWNLRLPKLLVEVTGGTKDFSLHPELVRQFRKSIVRVAVTTGAWILTGGTNTGVMKHVGEALRDHSRRSRNKITALGVVSWGTVENRESLEDDSLTSSSNRAKTYRLTSTGESEGASLDPNHTHFILVDNGTVNKYGVELPLRSRLEKLISHQSLYPGSEQCVPIVCLVLEGGINTISVVLQNVSQDPPIPIVVVAGSGRAADLITFAVTDISSNGSLSNEAEEALMKRIVAVFPQYPEKHEDLSRDILEIAYRKHLITIYRADSAENEDIDHAILLALLKASNLQYASQLKLALIWNRVDIAKDAIFTGDKKWEVKDLEASMELALLKNRVDFVKLLLEHVCIYGFLTVARLERLYNSNDEETFSTFSLFVRKIFPEEAKNGAQTKLSLYQVGIVMEKIIGNGFKSTYTLRQREETDKSFGICTCCKGKSEAGQSGSLMNETYLEHAGCADHGRIASPLTDLFIWAVLTCKYEMAQLLWQRGVEALAKAIVAFRLFTSMSCIAREKYNSEAADSLQEQSEFYRLKSIDLLSQSFEDNQQYTRLLLCAELKNWSSMTCLSMAARFHHIGFIAHPAVQFLLNDQWYGILTCCSGLKSFLVWMCSCSATQSEEDTSSTIMNNAYSYSTRRGVSRRWSYFNAADTRKSRRERNGSAHQSISSINWRRQSLVAPGTLTGVMNFSLFEKIYMVATAPVVKFWLNALCFFTFLCLFSIVLMTKMQKEISILEWVVVATVVALASEELRQVITAGESENLTFMKKLKRWGSDKWNLLDLAGVIFFFAGFTARVLQDGTPVVGRLFYALDIIFWYLRVLDILSVKKFMGPYVNMVGRMMWDTVTFTVLLFVFVTAYGVASRAVLHPNMELDAGSLKEIISFPYWQIYGELFMDEILPDCNDATTHNLGNHCKIAYGFVLTIMAVYLLIANVLLLNLLIAIFNNTFSKVIENANEIWKYHRYELIIEYSERPFLPPPLTLLIHVAMVMRWLVYACCKVGKKENAMKVILDDDGIELLRIFEDECMENYLRQQTLQEQASLPGIVQRTSERMDMNLAQLEQLQIYEADTRRRMKLLAEHVHHLATVLSEVKDTLKGDADSSTNPSTRNRNISGNESLTGNYDSLPLRGTKTRKISNVIGFGKSK
ncbi:Transient receptor potential cation channel subfamily M member 3 [Holothuria leucospilota]|uniref:Transient receptor potential cation channel subfamily M member 3 n=1 Tax=Holothuria leucospilota TaxID=206669 RepID=A0A9Q1H1U4_HOLLE|nr:Transient receptor potential cation channel subfamily M member 3 [Holothuria leucospilota]